MSKSFLERWFGSTSAMSDAGLAIDKTFCLIGSNKAEAPEDELASFMDTLSGHPVTPTAWFCANDRIAISLIQHLTAKAIMWCRTLCPWLVSDDIEAAQMVRPRLTTMHVQREQLAIEAVDLLLRRIEAASRPDFLRFTAS